MNETETYFSHGKELTLTLVQPLKSFIVNCLELTQSTSMTFDSLSESNLARLEQYLNTNPYREYSMSKPYFPKPSHATQQTNRLINQQQPSILAYHELVDHQKNALTLDRLAYKLRMKSDLNIDTLRETHLRRRTHHHHRRRRQQHFHPSQTHSNITESMSSIPPSTSAKTFGRQPTSITMSTNTMKTLMTDDLNGVEGNAVRVGTLNDLIKQFRRAEFRLVRRPADYLDSSSTYLSSNVSTNDRTLVNKSRHHHHQQSERPAKQPQALTEYRFNAPTFPATPSRTARDPLVHQGLIYQYRTRDRSQPTDLPLLHSRTVNSPDQLRPRLNSLVIEDRQSTAMSSHERRIQELREKSLMRTEKQLCVCNKLNIIDPFNSSQSEQNESTFPQLQQTQQQQPSVNYIFPPIRPFGYLTKKSTDESNQQSTTVPPPPPASKKKHKTKRRHLKNSKNSLDSLDKIDLVDNNDDAEDSQIFNETIQSMVSLTDLDETHNKTINIDLNLPTNLTPNVNEND